MLMRREVRRGVVELLRVAAFEDGGEGLLYVSQSRGQLPNCFGTVF